VEEKGLELLELINDYGDEKLEPINLELYYSPLCPFSRSVWLFCLENDIPITTHKIDLLKEDQGLDQAYKKFTQLSRSLQVPLLIDGDFVIEER
jgi:glutathione S-transferase